MTVLIRSYAQIVSVFVTILISLMILVWLAHSSVNLYWQQTYHHDSPFASLSQYKFWQKGDAIYQYLIRQKERIGQRLTLAGGDFGVTNPTELTSNITDNGMIDSHSLDTDLSSQSVVNSGVVVTDVVSNRTVILTPENSAVLFKVNSTIELVKEHAIIALPHHKTILRPVEQNTALDHVILHKDDMVFFVGDSLMQGVAPHIQKELFKQHGIKSINLSKQSTGLAYAGFFNWPAKVADTFQQNGNIKLMVVFLGPNDPWDFPNGSNKPYLKFKSSEWETVYQSRINLLLDKAIENGAKVIWIGAPNMKKAKLNMGMSYLNQLYQTSTMAKQQIYIDIHNTLSAENEGYVDFIQIDNRKVKMRTDDGIHFTRAGQVAIAQKVLSYIEIIDDKSVKE